MSQAPVAAHFGPHDEGFAACLMLDLRARGLDVRSARDIGSAPIAGVMVIRSWFADQPSFDEESLSGFSAHRLPRLVVRRNETKLHRDEGFGGWSHLALWSDYYQPVRTLGGKGAGGIGNVLELFVGSSVTLDLPDGYVFVSYHHGKDGGFVREWLRPALAVAGFTSWDYRMSERIPDPTTAEVPDPGITLRLRELLGAAGAVVVVATESWSSPYSRFELQTARDLAIPVLGVRSTDTILSTDAALEDLSIMTVRTDRPSAPKLIAALRTAGVRPWGK